VKGVLTVSDVGQTRTISIGTMRQWKSGLEQLGAGGDLELLRAVSEQRERQEAGDSTNMLTQEQISLIEGLTGIKCEYEEA
jgi:hypothetical protein